jgi:adenine-specific DNA-methyltransferase
MQVLLAQGFAGKFELIYIDPPFLSNSDYSHNVSIAGVKDVRQSPSMIERLAYRDTWSGGIDTYLDFLFPRLQTMRSLLSDNGTIYIHLGPSVAPYVRVLTDEIFGTARFQTTVIWKRTSAHSDTQGWGRNYDEILVYSKGDAPIWNQMYGEYSDEYVKSHYNMKGEDGRLFMPDNLTASGLSHGSSGMAWKGFDPSTKGCHWKFTVEKLDILDAQGRIYWPPSGGWPRYKRYLDEMSGIPLQSIWTDVPPVNSQAREDSGFDTQKPLSLLKRIISASSNPDGLVGDFFAGSGTTAVAAETLGRRWLLCDLGKVGIQVSRTRLVDIGAKPFVIENIGNYQRELIYREGGNIAMMQRIVMKLYGAEPHPAHTDIGILDDGGKRILVYVGYPDRPLTAKKTAELVKIARSLDGVGYDKLVLLAWDYEYNYDEGIEVRRKGFGVQVEPRLIPSSIYDYLRKSKNEDDLIEKFAKKIQFGAKPYLKVTSPKVTDRGGGEYNVVVAIEKYVLSEIPVENEDDRIELHKISAGDRFAVLIDYWAVDWDYDGKTFRSRWQDFRSNEKGGRSITTRANTTLTESRRFDIAVRVVDVFGNDATATTSVDLR